MAFTVQYETSCYLCGRTVHKNTQGYYFGEGQVAHYPNCPPKPKVCPNCFMEIPTGKTVCDCRL